MSTSCACNVAAYFISTAQEAGDPLTNLKLQKLLYYAQAWHLALFEDVLFEERIEAWPHGPVVPPVYGLYKGSRWNPIVEEVSAPVLNDHTREHLEEVMSTYGVHNAYYLESLAHQEAPWIDARGGIPPTAASNAVITPESMKAYFKSLL
jgi:uncharacterized phage-associated protein